MEQCKNCPRLAETDRGRCYRCEVEELRALCRQMAELITAAIPDAATWTDEGGLGDAYDRVMFGADFRAATTEG